MDTYSAAPPRLSIWRSLRAHVVLIIVTGLFGAGLAAAAAFLLPTTYSGTAVVLIRPLDGNAYSPDAQGSDLTNLQTEAQVVTSDVILDTVADALPEDVGTPNLTRGIDVIVAPNTQVLRITFRHARPETVEAVTSALADAYLDSRTERRDAFIESRRESIETRIAAVTRELRELRREGRDVDDPEMKSVAGQLLNLKLQETTLDSSEASPGQVIGKATATQTGLVLPVPLAVAAGLLVGLASGCVLALLRERRIEILRTVDAVERLGVPVLAHVTDPPAAGQPSDAALMVGAIVRRRVGQPGIIAVSSLREASRSYDFGSDLAHALAQGGEKVLLVDARSSKPSKVTGLSEALGDPPAVTKMARSSEGGFAQLRVGKHPDMGQRWYATARMDEVLRHAAGTHSWVVVLGLGIDHPLGRSIVAACPDWVPSVVLGRTSREDLDRGLTWSRTTGTEPLGLVALDPGLPRHAPEGVPFDDE